jgi:3,4-dihydroxy 2-butanone 4-phosphate synthase / GTP cyclohydrolase II
MTSQAFADVPTAIEEIRAGRMIVVVDDEDRENEGDITLAAEKVTPEAINFMAKYGRGLVCLTMTEERLEHLRIGPMSAENTSQYGTAFCEAIDARVGVTTGISAYDRARTIQVAIDPATQAWHVPATSSRFAPAKAECSSAPDKPKPPSTWRGLRD